MRVRNVTGGQMLLAEQSLLLTVSQDWVTVKDDPEVRFLVDAGALAVEPGKANKAKEITQ